MIKIAETSDSYDVIPTLIDLYAFGEIGAEVFFALLGKHWSRADNVGEHAELLSFAIHQAGKIERLSMMDRAEHVATRYR